MTHFHMHRVLELEVHFKTENKSLHMQILALEECNDHLQKEISRLKQAQSSEKTSSRASANNRAKNPPFQNNPHCTRQPPNSSQTPRIPSNPHPRAGNPPPPKASPNNASYRIVWGTHWKCTPDAIFEAISPLLPQNETGRIEIKNPPGTRGITK